MLTTKVVLKTHHFLIILVYFTLPYAFEVIYICCSCMAEIVSNHMLVIAHLFPTVFRCHVSGLKVATVGMFVPWKCTNATNQGRSDHCSQGYGGKCEVLHKESRHTPPLKCHMLHFMSILARGQVSVTTFHCYLP